MSEPESLDEQALEDDVVWDVLTHKYVFKASKHNSEIFEPEYQHPEDPTELFEEYERITDAILAETDE